MGTSSSERRIVRFGAFEVDLAAGKLRKSGLKIKLQEQPFQVLALLLERPGEVVTREELRQRLWPEDTFVDFDRSLNTAASRLREALGDSADNPRFIETLPRRGYRFVGPVERLGVAESGAGARRPTQPRLAVVAPSEQEAGDDRRRRLFTVSSTAPLVSLVVAVGIILAMWRYWPERSDTEPVRKFGFTAPVALHIGVGEIHADVAISPNGKHIVFNAGQERDLWTYDLDRGKSQRIAGTEGADDPFWAPDSDFIGFFVGREIKKVSVQRGVPVRVCRPAGPFTSEIDPSMRGGSWSPDGNSIVFSDKGSLYEVPAGGGTPQLLVSPEESEESPGGPTGLIRWPHFLPSDAGARVLVYTFGPEFERTMMVHDLETGRRERLGPGELPYYSPSGHILYQAGPSSYDLWALPFSLDTLQVTGKAFPISERSRCPTVAGDGTLVYVDAPGSEQLVWLNRGGERTGEIGQTETAFRYPALSRDGRFVAVTVGERWPFLDLWVYDIARGVRTRLTPAPDGVSHAETAFWSPTGHEVAFTTGGNPGIFLRRADGSGETKALVATPGAKFLTDWSLDGKHLLYELGDNPAAKDLWYLERNEDGSGWKPHPLLETPFNELAAQLSPDARYFAYVSDESGQNEIYVRSFPAGEGKWTVSSNGGIQPRWSRDGKELFYVEGGALKAVSVSTSPSFSVGVATRLFEYPSLGTARYPRYDVSPDGQRFLVAEPVREATEPSIRVVQNWFAEFGERVVQ